MRQYYIFKTGYVFLLEQAMNINMLVAYMKVPGMKWHSPKYIPYQAVANSKNEESVSLFSSY